MKVYFLLLVCLGTTLQLCSSKAFDELEKPQREDFQKYLLWGHALANSKHNLILGKKQPGDWLLNMKVVKKSASWIPFMTESAKYNYSVAKPGYVTCVEVMDQSNNGKGGYTTLLSGGPGYRNVTLSFRSQKNQPLNFIVSVYGKRP